MMTERMEVKYMTQGERVRNVRKSLNLTLEQFGKRVGVTKQTVSRIENGINNLTEQMIKSICREFNVDYIWLTTGEGEMFIDSDDEFMERIDRAMAGENNARKNMIKALLYASDDDIEAFCRIVQSYNTFSGEDPALSASSKNESETGKSVEELENEYKKMISNSASKRASTAISTTRNTEIKKSG